MDDIEPWEIWHAKAISAGVAAELATLGRAVVRDYWQHGRNWEEEQGNGSYLGADRHHAMMIALAKQKPALAKAVFDAALATGTPDEDQMQEALDEAERWTGACGDYGTPEWYEQVYALDGCRWDLHGSEQRL